MRRATVTSLGRFVPEKVLTNAELEHMIDTTDEWIVERTGISERHIVEPGTPTSELAAAAARNCLARRGLEPKDVSLIIVATVTPDMLFPATACLVQDKIGATRAWGFDLSAACCGFLYALTTGAHFVMSGTHDRVLVIGADVMSSIIDYQDRATCVLFGDGAGAVLLEPATKDGEGLLDFFHRIDGGGGLYLYMPGGGSLNPSSSETVAKKMHYVHQDGRQVFKYAVRQTHEVATTLLRRNNLTASELALFVCHQANARIIDATTEKLGLPAEKVVKNIDKFGNTTAATIPLALWDAHVDGRLKPGSLILLASVGAGFTSGAALVRWTGLASARQRG